ncbi:MAG TPA: aminotransferase class V-fold PLP-dependent enzyme [Bacteroidales bacterium]|nr:aminotransferase class V-fold PLP-dependent enzyme [Bacteroidales bacterium]
MGNKDLKGFHSRLLHAALSRPDAYGALQTPIYGCSAFEFESAESIAGAFNGTMIAPAYSRTANPTVEHFELQVKSITEAIGVVAFSSGMAAVSAAIMNVCKAGDNIVTTNKLFGNTVALYESTLNNFGISFKYADFTKPETIEPLIDGNTRAVLFEVLNNPFVEIADVGSISAIAHKHNLVVLGDTTLTPPNMFNARKFGIDISLVSSTKYISSGAAVIGGLVIDHGTYNWENNPKLKPFVPTSGQLTFLARLRKDILRNTGGCLSPFNAYLQSLGIETMQLRFERMAANALAVATWLSNNAEVKTVNYPALKGSKYEAVCRKQFTALPGGLMSFELESAEKCMKFINRLKLVKRATNMCDNKTLIIHPASTIYCDFTPEQQRAMGINEGLIRLSVGIEETEDIIADFAQAFGQ